MTICWKFQHLAIAVCCRLLLTASLWHAPVPWGHLHFGNSQALAEHIAEHHSHDAGDEGLDWHWHLVLPNWGHPSRLNDPSHGSLPAVTLCFDAAVIGVPVTCPLDTAKAFCSSISTLADLLAGHVQPSDLRAFLAVFALAHSAQQLLCKLRC